MLEGKFKDKTHPRCGLNLEKVMPDVVIRGTEYMAKCPRCFFYLPVINVVDPDAPEPEPVAEIPESPIEPQPEPVVGVEVVAESEVEPPESEVEPVTEPVVEPVTEPGVEPIVEPEPVVEPVVEPVTEPGVEPIVEPEPVIEPVVEPVTEPGVEPPEPVVKPEVAKPRSSRRKVVEPEP